MLVTVVYQEDLPPYEFVRLFKKNHHTMYGNGNMLPVASVTSSVTDQCVCSHLAFRMLLLGLLKSSREGDRISNFLHILFLEINKNQAKNEILMW